MSVGSNNTDGQKIVVFAEPGYLAHDAFTEGQVGVHWRGTGFDNMDTCLPSNTDAGLAGRAFLGIWQNAGTAVSGTDRGSLVRLGIAKALLKANTVAVKGAEAGYDPADGGVIVPYTSKKQVCIGRFTQDKASSASPQFVGVNLGDSSDASGGIFAANIAATAAITNTVTETAFAFATPVSFPANSLTPGKVLRIRGKANVTGVNAGDKLIVAVRFGGIAGVIVASTPTAGGGTAVAANDIATIDTTITIFSSTKLFSAGMSGCGPSLTSTMFQTGTNGQLTIDTTIANTLVLTGKWNNANAGNTVVGEDFTVAVLN